MFMLNALEKKFKLNKWRPPSLSVLTLMIFDMGLTHFGSEAKYMS